MNKDHYILLIYKHLKGEHSAEEQQALEAWTKASEDNRLFRQQLERDWEQTAAYSPDIEVDTKADFELLRQRMRAHKAAEKPVAKTRQLPNRRLWLSAAAAALALLLGFWWWQNSTNNIDGPNEMLAIQTGAGEKTSITLTDGTVVTLNENSELRYPKKFGDSERLVELKGEGFFDVTRIEKSDGPTNVEKVHFVIKTEAIHVAVIGTSFNVKAYPEQEETEVAVKSGKVRVHKNDSSESIALVANETARYDSKGKKIIKIDRAWENSTTWRTGLLRFSVQPLETVIADLEQAFDVRILLRNPEMSACPFSGRFTNAKLEEVLQALAAAFKMELEKTAEGDFVLKGGSC